MERGSRWISLAALIAVGCADPGKVVDPSAAIAISAPSRPQADLAPGETRTIFGPRLFTRVPGPPQAERFILSGFGASATMRITNGDASGERRVSSATIRINGADVVPPSSFSPQRESITTPLSLPNPATIEVTLTGAPGSVITISIDGSLATDASITPAGGNAELLGGAVLLVVPPGALSAESVLTAEPAQSPDGASLPGTTLDLGPSGTSFSTPVTLGIRFDPSALPRWVNPAELRMFWWNANHWELLADNQVDMANSRVTATTTHFSTFALLPNSREFCPGDPAADASLQQAVDLVPDNGTVYTCDGTFTVDSVSVNRPMTIRAEHDRMTTLKDLDVSTSVQTFGRPSLVVQNASGTVRIVGFRFEVSGRAIGVVNHRVVQIDSTDFQGSSTAAVVHVFVRAGRDPGPASRVDISRSTFQHMAIGAFITRNAEGNADHSIFEDFSVGSITHSSVFDPSVGRIGATGIVEYNLFRNCSPLTCLRTFARSTDIRHNRFELTSGPSRNSAIEVLRQSGTIDAQPLVIEDNEIVAAQLPGDPAVATTYTARAGIITSDGSAAVAGPNVIQRNHITRAFIGISTTTAANVHDNIVENGVRAFSHTSGGPVVIQRNDFVNMTGSFAGTSTGNYRCNWWGSAAGPVGAPATVPVATYTPFATAPVANSSTPCTP